MGSPAARKSTAIDVGTSLLRKVKYKYLAPQRMGREAFLEEMIAANQPDLDEIGDIENLIDRMDDLDGGTSEFTAHASEFVDFMGQGDKDYLMMFTTLYDNLPEYKNPKITRKSVVINKPTVNLLGASTPENLNMVFPANMMDTGTLRRFLFIHGDPVKEKILIPSGSLCPENEKELVEHLAKVRELRGVMRLDDTAHQLLEGIYKMYEPMRDPRFSFYSGGRLTHLLKICSVVAASRLSLEISAEDVLRANTYLCAAEVRMPVALGHFGSSKHSQATHNIIEYLEARPRKVSVQEAYRVFSSEFGKQAEFLSLLGDLQEAGKLKVVALQDGSNKTVLEVVRETIPTWAKDLIVPEALTKDELEVIGL